MPKISETGNVKKRCDCVRSKWGSCAHPWHVDYKAPKDHPRRAGERYRKNLDLVSKTHAASLADAKIEAKRAILAWLDGRDPAALQPGDRPTLAQLLEEYGKRPNAGTSEAEQVTPITTTIVQGRPFGEWHAADVTRRALDAFQAARPKIAGNRNLALLRAMFRWAIAAGFKFRDGDGELVPQSPFRIGEVNVVRLAREEARTRRLQGTEETRLIEAARTLAPLVIAALETGCRRGELLSLQWQQVWFAPKAEIFLPAGKTKAKKDRRIPISSALRAVLDARRNDPAGEPLPPEAYVFGDEIGRRRQSIKTAWRLTCKRAKITDLHFHDLRREAGSRWMDAGVPLATIQRWLGHHNISQTSKYLAASLGADADDMAAYEQRIGRVTQRDIFRGSDGHEPIQSSSVASEPTNKDAVVH